LDTILEDDYYCHLIPLTLVTSFIFVTLN